MIKVYVKENEPYSKPITYVLKILAKSRNVDFHYESDSNVANLIWDHQNEKSEPILTSFYESLSNENADFSFFKWLNDKCEMITSEGQTDLMGTIFYMINCLQEKNASDSLDHFGRFLYEKSYQNQHDNASENLVQHGFDSFLSRHNISCDKKKSKIFISHDIDTIYGSLFQDGFWALKHGRLDVVFKILLLEVIRKPGWKNIDKIMSINDEYGLRSTFFWLVNKKNGSNGIKNADYSIKNEEKLLKSVSNKGFVNGLHKSVSEHSLNLELSNSSLLNPYNRYHFLYFLPHIDWPKISKSKIEFDASLGFAEHHGFRNSYGNPFQPYDIMKDQPYDFIEAPLHCMDTTFHKYLKMNNQNIGQTVINFFERNKYDGCLSLLWHNTYFTSYKYKGFLKEYLKILAYLYEEKVDYVLPQELIKEFKIEW